MKAEEWRRHPLPDFLFKKFKELKMEPEYIFNKPKSMISTDRAESSIWKTKQWGRSTVALKDPDLLNGLAPNEVIKRGREEVEIEKQEKRRAVGTNFKPEVYEVCYEPNSEATASEEELELGTISLPNGGTYKGELRNNVPHGNGNGYRHDKTLFYQGAYVNGLFEGFGREFDYDRVTVLYEGFYNRGEPSVRGNFSFQTELLGIMESLYITE